MSQASDFASSRDSLPLGTHRRALVAAVLSVLGILPGLREGTDARKRNKQGKRRKQRRKKPESPQPTVQVAASCAGAGDISAGVAPPQRLAQTFTAAVNGMLIRAEVTIAKVADSFGDYFLHLSRVDNFGVPTNEVLSVASVANPDVPEGSSTVTFMFPNPAPLTAGVRFALVLSRTGNDQVFWFAIVGDLCGGEAFQSLDQTAPFTRFTSNADFIYTVFVQ